MIDSPMWHISFMPHQRVIPPGGAGTNQYQSRGMPKTRPAPPLLPAANLMLTQIPGQGVLWPDDKTSPEETLELIDRAWTSGFSVREPLWRHVGNILPEYPEDRGEAKRYAGHQWEPIDQPVFEPIIAADGKTDFVPMPGYKRIVRSDTNAAIGVSAVTRSTIGIDDMYDLIEGLAKDPGISYESGGVLEGGKSVWVVAKLDHPITIPGDESRLYPYITIHNRIVGPGACNVQWTTLRSASASSLSIKELYGGDSEIHVPLNLSVRHTKNWKARITTLEKSVMGVREHSAVFQQKAAELANQRISSADVDVFVARFIPMPPEGIISDIVKENIERERSNFMQVFNGRANRGINSTGWGLVMAACEYTDHVKAARSMESRFRRSLLKPEPQKRQAVKIVESLH